jgi:hypothetical protein
MFQLIVLAMFGLMLYGLWTLLGNLAVMALSRDERIKPSRRNVQGKGRTTSTRPVSPSTDRLNSIHAQAELERRKQFEREKLNRLRRRLVGMLRGNETAADRLVESARKAKPFMGDEWYYEKAIADLERDRFR